MLVNEYLKGLNKEDKITFIISKGDNTYYQTPIRVAYEWSLNEKLCNAKILRIDSPPIDTTTFWTNWYDAGQLKCCIIKYQ